MKRAVVVRPTPGAVVQGIDDAGRPARRPALVGVALTVAGLAGTAVGLYNA